jgi:hypothetical protein
LKEIGLHQVLTSRRVSFLCWAGAAAAFYCGLCSITAGAQEVNLDELAFFESKIRPVLIDHCYECHGADPHEIKGGLNLTYRGGMQTQTGGAVIPGNAGASILLDALRYQDPDLQMPPTGILSEEIVHDFETWIAMGAPDPRETPSTAESLHAETSWEATLERRMKWWSFQPLESPPVPEVDDADWSGNPVDSFIMSRLSEEGIDPAPLADSYTIVRRLHFITTGLPPSDEEIVAFVAAAKVDRQAAVNAAVDRLLASPRFGERWARHWMDWLRYADSHGSEGDPRIPYAWRYREYLIRALNADVPYDDMVREHIAGDLLPNPRVNNDLGVYESSIGAAQYRFVLHGYGPTDALAEQVRFTDNQIDVISKAFLATTVSCARCHDHKFDPVSQKDFYALYGIMASSRPATVTVDTAERLGHNKAALTAKKAEIRALLADVWEDDLAHVKERLKKPNETLAEAIANATTPRDPLHPWQRLANASDESFRPGWGDLRSQWRASQEALEQRREANYPLAWNLASDDGATWSRHGNGLDAEPSPAGEFALAAEGDDIVMGIYPAGIYTHALSTKHSGVISSPRFEFNESEIYVRIAGGGGSIARPVIQNYPSNGTVYPVSRMGQRRGRGERKGWDEGDWRWQRWNMDYWQGDSLYLELSTAMDQPLLARTNASRSWFGITDAVIVEAGEPGPKDEMAEYVAPLFEAEGDMEEAEHLAERYEKSLRASVKAWRDNAMTDAQAHYLSYFVRTGVLTNSFGVSADLDASIRAYRDLEAEVPVPTRVPGVIEGIPFDQAFFNRGDHTNPGDPVPRRFLEAIDPKPYATNNAGRLELAESIVDDGNPLTARVIANRMWHHVFGRGLVLSTDDFGGMGRTPSHPELLDYLADRMKSRGWSMKEMIRDLVTSRTFQLSSKPSDKARAQDPANALLSHANARRLEGEAIRDALLLAGGRLDLTPPEESVSGDSNHRSVYVRVLRNRLDPFLTTFDAPTPVSTKGRRDDTNVPAHALTMMNDPFVRGLAESFAARINEDETLTDDRSRIEAMFRATTGRPPTASESTFLLDYLEAAQVRPSADDENEGFVTRIADFERRIAELKEEMAERIALAKAKDPELAEASERRLRRRVNPERSKQLANLESQLEYVNNLAGPAEPWVELAHSLFNAKEFIYLR